MNYTTLSSGDFYIKKNNTLPEIKFPITQRLMERYDITESMLNNVAVTFSMVDSETGLYRIANVSADLVVNNNISENNNEKYTLVYRLTQNQTKQIGRFCGEFKLDFLDEGDNAKLTLPIDDYLNIVINDGITKTTVI